MTITIPQPGRRRAARPRRRRAGLMCIPAPPAGVVAAPVPPIAPRRAAPPINIPAAVSACVAIPACGAGVLPRGTSRPRTGTAKSVEDADADCVGAAPCAAGRCWNLHDAHWLRGVWNSSESREDSELQRLRDLPGAVAVPAPSLEAPGRAAPWPWELLRLLREVAAPIVDGCGAALPTPRCCFAPG